jgi:hypothetical protein
LWFFTLWASNTWCIRCAFLLVCSPRPHEMIRQQLLKLLKCNVQMLLPFLSLS